VEFRFDANQEYQVRAIEAVMGLLEGQPRIEVELEFVSGNSSFAAIANRLDLDDGMLLSNLRAVQFQYGIAPEDGLQSIEATIETPNGQRDIAFANFSIEMETGTGKTYVYLRTVLERTCSIMRGSRVGSYAGAQERPKSRVAACWRSRSARGGIWPAWRKRSSR
jgi:type III restriction enzyme